MRYGAALHLGATRSSDFPPLSTSTGSSTPAEHAQPAITLSHTSVILILIVVLTSWPIQEWLDVHSYQVAVFAFQKRLVRLL